MQELPQPLQHRLPLQPFAAAPPGRPCLRVDRAGAGDERCGGGGSGGRAGGLRCRPARLTVWRTVQVRRGPACQGLGKGCVRCRLRLNQSHRARTVSSCYRNAAIPGGKCRRPGLPPPPPDPLAPHELSSHSLLLEHVSPASRCLVWPRATHPPLLAQATRGAYPSAAWRPEHQPHELRDFPAATLRCLRDS